MNTDGGHSPKHQGIENLKATIAELENTIAAEFDKESIAELEVLDGLEKKQ